MSCGLLSSQSHLWSASWWRCWRSRMVCCCWRWRGEPRPQVCALRTAAAGGAGVWPGVCRLDQVEVRPSSEPPWVLRQRGWRCCPAGSPALQTCRPPTCALLAINPLGFPPGSSRPRVWPRPGATISLMRVWCCVSSWLSHCSHVPSSQWSVLGPTESPCVRPPPVSLSSPGSTLGKYADLQLQTALPLRHGHTAVEQYSTGTIKISQRAERQGQEDVWLVPSSPNWINYKRSVFVDLAIQPYSRIASYQEISLGIHTGDIQYRYNGWMGWLISNICMLAYLWNNPDWRERISHTWRPHIWD